MSGKILGERYELGERIGVGGMAAVYAAHDTVLDRKVAVKVMLPQYAADPSFAKRFRQEATAAANLQSPRIVTIYDWGQDGGDCYLVMELLPGSDLRDPLASDGPLPSKRVAEIGSQVCEALAVAHDHDVIHRDIAPQNIMILPSGAVKVMDFGIAKVVGSDMTQTSTILGTARYLSPEQAQGRELTAASDLYSLGAVLYEAAAGRPPFTGPDPISVALQHVGSDPEPPYEANPNVDVDLSAVIMRALEKDPARRFASAREMGDALDCVARGEVPVLPRLEPSEEATCALPALNPQNEEVTRVIPRPFSGQPNSTLVMRPIEGSEDTSPAKPLKVTADAPAPKASRGTRIAAASILVAAALASCVIAAVIRPWEPATLPDTGSGGGASTAADEPAANDQDGSNNATPNTSDPNQLNNEESRHILALERALLDASSYDNQIGRAAQNFNENYLKDTPTRKNHAESAEVLERDIKTVYANVSSLGIPESSPCHQAWQDLIELYHALDQRIEAITAAWDIDLSYSSPAAHEAEILEPLNRARDETGNNRYYTRFKELFPTITIPSLPSDGTSDRHVENQFVAFDIPEYWVGRVNVVYSGNNIIIRSKKDPSTAQDLLAIEVFEEDYPVEGGDIGGGLVFYRKNSHGQQIVFTQANYPYIASMEAKSSDRYKTSDSIMDEYIRLQTGNKLTYDEAISAPAESSISSLAHEFFEEKIAPTIQVK